MSIKIMIVDDHAMIREGIKRLLEYDGSMEVIAEASDGNECLSILKNTKPDVLLLDINMPGKNGIEVLKEIREKNMNLKVLILTVHNEVEYLLKAIDIGVEGYILKDSESAELKRAITSILQGDDYIQPSLIPALNANLMTRDIDKERLERLTKRELEVLIEMASGVFNRDIAKNLNISERTVKNHISNIFKKIEVADRTQAAVFAIKNSLVNIH